ncbi:DUF2242 domain-containing protein [Acidovorax sp. NCPPB 3576]|uniref:DUF2242 domain-containing protein n=1 Tax=Acidovorax sp. NCPPB 3576 TaxID=2940488 RepID=UPI002348EF11|nr:DUF2242 domain-containing protein [Acidovorax sp. NCPPB 3576]WCM89896.1 DUF2242 domain-containing protein [Acidovorax sp. NCPPB 3576]
MPTFRPPSPPSLQSPRRPRHLAVLALSAALVAILAGCANSSVPGLDRAPRFDPDDFDSASMHTRHINAPQARVCEGARRALLSQGYLVSTASAEVVAGRKYFQPSSDIHYEVEMRVVCATEGGDKTRTAAFASALQDRYVIKKINNSASLGVGALGSVSLPFSASDDTLVKVGSETVTDPRFYDRFFQLFDRFVPAAREQVGQASPSVPPTPANEAAKKEARESGEVHEILPMPVTIPAPRPPAVTGFPLPPAAAAGVEAPAAEPAAAPAAAPAPAPISAPASPAAPASTPSN